MPSKTDLNPYYYIHKRNERNKRMRTNPPKTLFFTTKEERDAFIKAHPNDVIWDGYHHEDDDT